MKRLARVWRSVRGRRGDQRSEGDGVDRRTLLTGAAAAGVVAVGASAVNAAPAGSAGRVATSGAVAQQAGGSVAASDVSVVAVGEIVDTNAQAVFEDFDRRMSKMRPIEDLQVAMVLVDDFMGGTGTSGAIGELGWALPEGTTGTAAPSTNIPHPGVFSIGTGTTATGWQGMNLGTNNLQGHPVFLCEWRAKVTGTNTTAQACSVWFGLHNNASGGEPTSGFYFRSTLADGPNWQAVCASSGSSRTWEDTGKAVDAIYHRFRITCDGVNIARFYIDDVLVATMTSSIPTGRYTANATIRKTAGTTARAFSIDYFALRYEFAR